MGPGMHVLAADVGASFLPTKLFVSHGASGVAQEACQLYCLCRESYDRDRPMVACDECEEWYHYECVGLRAPKDDEDDNEVAPKNFMCPPCCMKVLLQSPSFLIAHLPCTAGLADSCPLTLNTFPKGIFESCIPSAWDLAVPTASFSPAAEACAHGTWVQVE